MSILNAAVASTFKECAERLKEILKKKSNRDEAIMELVREISKETKAIRFEGNGYSQEWKTEAKKRGLPILNTTPEALKVFTNKKSTQFLVDTKVLSQEEIASRFHINVERYVKTLDIEFMTLHELVKGFVIPAVEKQIIQIGSSHSLMKSPGLKKVHKSRLDELEKNFTEILKNLEAFEKVVTKSQALHDEVAKMDMFVAQVVPAAEKLRVACDLAETLVSDEFWTLPKYREMLFSNTLTT